MTVRYMVSFVQFINVRTSLSHRTYFCQRIYKMPRLMTQLIERIHSFILRTKGSRSAVLLIVFYTNMLDNLLLTSVVPIIPEILIDLDKYSLKNSLETSKDNVSNTGNGSTAVLVVEDDTSEVNVTELGFAKRILQVSFNALDENSKVGWLLSSKALIQLFANPVVGRLCSRYGYSVILCTGTNILLLSSFIYTMCGSFVPLLVARCIQGIGSAACTIAGMSLLADRYPDDRERSQVMGIAMGGTALGVVIGYPFGGFLYAYAGKLMPFALLSSFIVIDAALQLVVLNPSLTQKVSMIGTPIHRLLRDPYILIASGTVMVTTMSMATLEPTVPIWILDTMHAQKWQLGLVFLPDSIGYFVGTNFFGVITKTVGRWICSLSCMLLIGLCLTCIPFATSVTQLILPHFGLGLGLGITDAAIMPLLALLVDTRHVAAYGCVYSIVQLAVCLAYGLGPSIAGQIVKAVGFSWLIWGLAILNVGYSPLCWFLRNPSVQEENKPILDTKEDTYTEY